MGAMKTLLDIDEGLLRSAQEAAGAPTKKATVTLALRELLRSKRRSELASMLGRHRHGMTLKQLQTIRSRA